MFLFVDRWFVYFFRHLSNRYLITGDFGVTIITIKRKFNRFRKRVRDVTINTLIFKYTKSSHVRVCMYVYTYIHI